MVLIFAATTSAAPNPRACIYHSAALEGILKHPGQTLGNLQVKPCETPRDHTAHYVQLSHFIYFSPSSASTEGEYGILEPKFPDGGHCQSVLRRQWVRFTSTLNVRVEGTSALRDMRATRSTPPNGDPIAA